MTSSTRLLAFALTTALSFGQLHAAEPDGTNSTTLSASGNSTTLEKELGRQMDKYVIYPVMGNADGLFGDVVVSFVINTEGRVEVIGATASNEALRQYVLTKLAKVDVGENPTGMWRTTHVRFRFRPQA